MRNPCHHLIEHQQSAVLLGEFPQTFQEAGFGLNESSVANDRFENDTGNGIRVLGEQRLDRLQIVVGSGEGVGCGAARYSGGIGQAEGCHTGSGLHQEHVGVAVIAAFKLDHLVASGEGAHQSKNRHAGLGAAVDEAHHLDAGNSVDHHLGQGVLEGTGSTEARALFDGLLQSADHLGVGMAADGRPPAADVIDVFVPIHVPGVGTFHPIKHDRLTADRLERPHRGAHATGHQPLSCAEDGLGAAGVQRGCCHWNRRQEADANRATS